MNKSKPLPHDRVIEVPYEGRYPYTDEERDRLEAAGKNCCAHCGEHEKPLGIRVVCIDEYGDQNDALGPDDFCSWECAARVVATLAAEEVDEDEEGATWKISPVGPTRVEP